MAIKKILILMLLFFSLLLTPLCLNQKRTTEEFSSPTTTQEISQKTCANISCLESVIVNEDSLQIKIAKAPCSNSIFRKEKDGNLSIFEDKYEFTLAVDENINWGDGEHVFEKLTVEDIANKKAQVVVEHENRPLGKPIEITQTRCQISENYP
jgi:hypothetical protein